MRKVIIMRNIKSVRFIALEILFVVSVLIGLPSVFFGADTYPSKPVRLIIPIAAGGGTDITGRLIATKLSERLGKQVVVENHGGAGGIIGTEMAAKAKPDGYTLLFVPVSFTMQPALQKLPYDSVRSFAPIAMVGNAAYSLVVHPSVPANSLKELIALAKQKPGQLVFGATGIGSTSHMVIELFKTMAGIDFKIVHFKGGGPQTVDLLGGHSHGTMLSLPPMMPHIISGKLRALGTTGSKRSVFLPEVPTIAEAGLPGYEAGIWWGILAPAGIPAPIVERLSKELRAILALDDAKKMFSNQGAEADYLGPAEFGSLIEKEITRWTSVVKKANIKVE
jgi:tripartite-type tricarboxylate transporter receptor subunit TctC